MKSKYSTVPKLRIDARYVPAEFRQLLDLHSEGSAILVSKAAADCWNVHFRFDARGGEEAPEIVVRELRKTEFTTCGLQAFLGVLNFADGLPNLRASLILEVL